MMLPYKSLVHAVNVQLQREYERERREERERERESGAFEGSFERFFELWPCLVSVLYHTSLFAFDARTFMPVIKASSLFHLMYAMFACCMLSVFLPSPP